MAVRDFLGMKWTSLRRTDKDYFVVYPLGKKLKIAFATPNQAEAEAAKGRVSQASIVTIAVTLTYFVANLGGELTTSRFLGYVGILLAYIFGAIIYVRAALKSPQRYSAKRHGVVVHA